MGDPDMLNILLIAICLVLMTYLSHHWLGLTAEMQSENRHKRLTKHLDWQAPQTNPRRTGKLSR
jgi:hypothetical protein